MQPNQLQHNDIAFIINNQILDNNGIMSYVNYYPFMRGKVPKDQTLKNNKLQENNQHRKVQSIPKIISERKIPLNRKNIPRIIRNVPMQKYRYPSTLSPQITEYQKEPIQHYFQLNDLPQIRRNRYVENIPQEFPEQLEEEIPENIEEEIPEEILPVPSTLKNAPPQLPQRPPELLEQITHAKSLGYNIPGPLPKNLGIPSTLQQDQPIQIMQPKNILEELKMGQKILKPVGERRITIPTIVPYGPLTYNEEIAERHNTLERQIQERPTLRPIPPKTELPKIIQSGPLSFNEELLARRQAIEPEEESEEDNDEWASGTGLKGIRRRHNLRKNRTYHKLYFR